MRRVPVALPYELFLQYPSFCRLVRFIVLKEDEVDEERCEREESAKRAKMGGENERK